MLDPSALTTVSWQCVHFTHSDGTSSLDALIERGVAVTTIDGNAVLTKETLLDQLAKALRFPDYFGQNWDAVDDCLRDMEWLAATGCVLVVQNAQQLWTGNGVNAGKLVEAWLMAAEHWVRREVAFHLVFVW